MGAWSSFRALGLTSVSGPLMVSRPVDKARWDLGNRLDLLVMEEREAPGPVWRLLIPAAPVYGRSCSWTFLLLDAPDPGDSRSCTLSHRVRGGSSRQGGGGFCRCLSWWPGREAALGGLRQGESTGGRELAIGQLFSLPVT